MVDRDDAFLAILEIEDVLKVMKSEDIRDALETRVATLRKYVRNSENKIVGAV